MSETTKCDVCGRERWTLEGPWDRQCLRYWLEHGEQAEVDCYRIGYDRERAKSAALEQANTRLTEELAVWRNEDAREAKYQAISERTTRIEAENTRHETVWRRFVEPEIRSIARLLNGVFTHYDGVLTRCIDEDSFSVLRDAGDGLEALADDYGKALATYDNRALRNLGAEEKKPHG